jgi:hypothetical protein
VTSSTHTTADHYRVLGIGRDADSEEIRAAYRAKMRLWHPDLIPGADEDVRQAATGMTARLNEAYECLIDPEGRPAYEARDSENSQARHASSAPQRSQRTSRSRHRLRQLTTISLGGIVAPLLGLTWASGALPAPPANQALVAALCAGVIAATIWVLTASRLLRRPDRLSPIGVVWSHLMRWSGWVLIGGCVIFLGIPVIVFTLTVVIGAPFFGLVLIALISGRFDSADKDQSERARGVVSTDVETR